MTTTSIGPGILLASSMMDEADPVLGGHCRCMKRLYIVLVVAGVSAGCSSGDAGSSAGPTSVAAGEAAPPAVCSSTEALRSSMAGLMDVEVVENGTAALQDAVAAVESDLQQVVDDATSQYSTQVDQLQAGFDGVETAARAALETPSVATLDAVRASIGALGSDVTGFADEIASTC
jgi:hypothetical protein